MMQHKSVSASRCLCHSSRPCCSPCSSQLTPMSLPEEKSQINSAIKDSSFNSGTETGSYTASSTGPVYATKSEGSGSPGSVCQYVSVSELSPAPASPDTAASVPAHMEAMLTTLQPFNPTSLVADNQGFPPASLFPSYPASSYQQYSSPYYTYSASVPSVSLKWN